MQKSAKNEFIFVKSHRDRNILAEQIINTDESLIKSELLHDNIIRRGCEILSGDLFQQSDNPFSEQHPLSSWLNDNWIKKNPKWQILINKIYFLIKEETRRSRQGQAKEFVIWALF